jgi:hypothetical protein
LAAAALSLVLFGVSVHGDLAEQGQAAQRKRVRVEAVLLAPVAHAAAWAQEWAKVEPESSGRGR